MSQLQNFKTPIFKTKESVATISAEKLEEQRWNKKNIETQISVDTTAALIKYDLYLNIAKPKTFM